MYILCEITDDGGVALCDGCGSDIQEAAADAVRNLVHGFDEDWIDKYVDDLEWKFTKIYPKRGKYVPPLWKPSGNYLNEILQDGADSSVSLQV